MASASASAVSQFLSTYATSSMTEFFMWTKKSACPAFYDDLSKHALAYRELSLLLRQPPGREAFPGEIFFVHSRLLERSCKPHVSGFITTNMISITDGQIFLSVDLFLANYRPAVDVGLSVTRVGSAAQTSSMKQVGGAFKIDMAGPETQVRLARGVRLITLLTQDAGNTLSIRQQVQTLCLSNQDSFVEMSTPQLKRLSRPKKICRRIFCRHSYHSCLYCLNGWPVSSQQHSFWGTCLKHHRDALSSTLCSVASRWHLVHCLGC
jgi:F-type H+-transporting ATPase subunit alpha